MQYIRNSDKTATGAFAIFFLVTAMFIPLFLLFSIGCGVAYTIIVVNQDKHDESYSGTIIKTEVSKLTCETLGNQKFWHNIVILEQDNTGRHIPVVLNKWGYFVTDGQSVEFNDETFKVGDRVRLFTVEFNDVYQKAKAYKVLTDEEVSENKETAIQTAIHSTVPQASVTEMLAGYPEKPLPVVNPNGQDLVLQTDNDPLEEVKNAPEAYAKTINTPVHEANDLEGTTQAAENAEPSIQKETVDLNAQKNGQSTNDLTQKYTLFVTRQVGGTCEFWTQTGDGRDIHLPSGTISQPGTPEKQLKHAFNISSFVSFSKIGEIDEKGGARVRYVQQESPVYKAPGGESVGWLTLPRGIEVEEHKRDGDWVQVQYVEVDTSSFPNQEMLSVKGWIHQQALTDSQKRSFYHAVVDSELHTGKWMPLNRYYVMRGKSNEWFRTAKNALRYDFEKNTAQEA